MRLDIFLTEQKLAETRNKAVTLIKEGFVLVNGVKAEKPSQNVSLTDNVTLTGQLKFVSRGGYKLEHALSLFHIDVENKIALDIGASTGGFTDCLLQHKAQKVYAVDVGTNQIHKTLKENPKVFIKENEDIRNFSLPEKVDIAVCDVSFISLFKIIPLFKHFLKNKGVCILLVKPQFELGKDALNKKGVVKEKDRYTELLSRISNTLIEEGFGRIETITSPIEGGDGNTEFLLKAICMLK